MENSFYIIYSNPEKVWVIVRNLYGSPLFRTSDIRLYYEKTKKGEPCFTGWSGNYKKYTCLATAQRQCRRLNALARKSNIKH